MIVQLYSIMNKKDISQRPFLGAHVSISGGFENSIKQAKILGCHAIQIFSKNQMRWSASDINDQAAENFIEKRKTGKIEYLLIHDSYLINLGNPDEAKRERSATAFSDEIKRAKRLGAEYLIFHPGSHLGIGDDACLKLISDSLKSAILKESPSETNLMILIETTAGQGTNVGYKFEHLAKIIELTNDKSIGVCIDTCHIFAAGYDIRNKKSYNETMDSFKNIVGLRYLKAFHINDSKTKFASRVDRHANIGEGFIGADAFRFLLNDSRLTVLPMILETPGGLSAYKKDLETLSGLFQDSSYM